MREVERFDVEFDKFFYIWQPATGNSGQLVSAHTRSETPYPQ
jgi:hypothetical protein